MSCFQVWLWRRLSSRVIRLRFMCFYVKAVGETGTSLANSCDPSHRESLCVLLTPPTQGELSITLWRAWSAGLSGFFWESQQHFNSFLYNHRLWYLPELSVSPSILCCPKVGLKRFLHLNSFFWWLLAVHGVSSLIIHLYASHVQRNING